MLTVNHKILSRHIFFFPSVTDVNIDMMEVWNQSGTTVAMTTKVSIEGEMNPDDTLYKVISTILYIVVGAVSIIGNGMVIIVVLRVKSMRTPTNCHLVSLAIADALIGLVPIYLHSIPENFGNGSWFGPYGCVLIVYIEYLAFNVSAVSIAAFTAERYIAICHPMKSHYMCTIKRAVKIIIGAWFGTAIYCIWWLILVKYDESKGCTYNENYQHLLQYVYVADCILFYLIPVGIAIPTYIVIGRALYRSTRSRSTMVASYLRKREDGTSEKTKDRGDTSRKQVIKMLFLVVALFTILWLPYRFVVVANWVFNANWYDQWLLFFIRASYYLNSAVNPLIYNFMSKNFRRAFRKMCPCLGKLMRDQNGTFGQGVDRNTTYSTCSTNAPLQGDSVL